MAWFHSLFGGSIESLCSPAKLFQQKRSNSITFPVFSVFGAPNRPTAQPPNRPQQDHSQRAGTHWSRGALQWRPKPAEAPRVVGGGGAALGSAGRPPLVGSTCPSVRGSTVESGLFSGEGRGQGVLLSMFFCQSEVLLVEVLGRSLLQN